MYYDDEIAQLESDVKSINLKLLIMKENNDLIKALDKVIARYRGETINPDSVTMMQQAVGLRALLLAKEVGRPNE
jgi:hypothetical protein